MPSFYMHERAALTSLGELCDKSAAALGACGPDTLYFSGAGELRALGKRLHCERTSEFLVYILRACADDAACRDYAMGFLSHYAVDVAFHPFVYALSTTPLGYSSLRHIATERALDAWLMGISRVPRASAPDELEISEINARLGAAIMLWQPDTKLDAAELKRALKRCMGLGGALGRLGGEPGALRVDDEAGMEQLVSPDQLQAFALSGWRNPWTRIVSCDGPFELLGAALKRTDELIAAARLYWRGMMDASTLCAVLGDRSYLSGEYWRTSPPPEPLEAGRLRAVKRVFMGAKSKAKK